MGARFLGKYGFLIVSVFGGLVGSASTTAAAANLSMHGRLSPPAAAVAAVLTSVASALVNLPVLYRQTRQKEETRTLSVLCFLLVLIGLGVLLVRGSGLGRKTIKSSDLIQAESTLIGSAATFDLTNKELARVKGLAGISQRELEQATSDQQTADGALKAAWDPVRVFGNTNA